MTPLDYCKIVSLNKIEDHRGNLTFIENQKQVPFSIQRVYYLYDVPASVLRGGHAHKELQQLIIAVSGSFTIHLDDGFQKKTFFLNKPYEGLYLCPMVWREIDDFSSASVCLVMASLPYDENDYYRDYEKFVGDANQ